MRRDIYQLFAESIIVQSLIALIVVVTISYLAAAGRPIPDPLLQIGWLVLGFWFGAKTEFARRRAGGGRDERG